MSLSPEDRKKLNTRRNIAAKKYRSGLGVKQIACDLGVSTSVVINDLQKFELHTVEYLSKQREAYVQERRERIADLVSEGLSTGQISERTGHSRSLVNADRKALGISASPGGVSDARRQAYRVAVETRRASVQKMLESGATLEAIAKKLDVSVQTIKRDLKALGLSAQTASSVQSKQDILLEELKWLFDGGTSVESASKSLGISEKRVKQYCNELGLLVK